ncbi:helix-turn-helix domain-containing protein [Vagococcus hydrophili]|uniref:Helix-turn-helix domain-containing protein n=1 Tax=Vagococcus hydrophili TaxID=2714947 RepID=A0A6G8AUD9_9ENTE|nr:Rgg/GadR/MutR family transcriptional regulator [Vagococcus hydrophili]QIL48701.1 helix-turn-helix domain-containing protein [Vagococcus hydrophili]
MDEGTLFRKLRKDRGLSLEQVSDELNSVSFISKFEKGNSNISLHRMERLLNNINVSVEEFFYLRELEKNTTLNEDIKILRGYLTSEFYYYVARLLSVNDQAVKKSFEIGIIEMKKIKDEMDAKKSWQKFIAIYCDICIYTYKNNLDEIKDKNPKKIMEEINIISKPVITYLYKVEDWSVFELVLFKLFLFTFKAEQIHQLLPLAIARTEKESQFHVMMKFKSEIIFSGFSYFVNYRLQEWAKESLDLARKMLKNQMDLTSSTCLLFYEGWYQLIFEDFEKGIESCHQAISIFRILEQPKMEGSFKLILRNILKNKEQPDEYFMFV